LFGAIILDEAGCVPEWKMPALSRFNPKWLIMVKSPRVLPPKHLPSFSTFYYLSSVMYTYTQSHTQNQTHTITHTHTYTHTHTHTHRLGIKNSCLHSQSWPRGMPLASLRSFSSTPNLSASPFLSRCIPTPSQSLLFACF
jgi:hypothetical protein